METTENGKLDAAGPDPSAGTSLTFAWNESGRRRKPQKEKPDLRVSG
jgi:hypothetical protein